MVFSNRVVKLIGRVYYKVFAQKGSDLLDLVVAVEGFETGRVGTGGIGLAGGRYFQTRNFSVENCEWFDRRGVGAFLEFALGIFLDGGQGVSRIYLFVEFELFFLEIICENKILLWSDIGKSKQFSFFQVHDALSLCCQAQLEFVTAQSAVDFHLLSSSICLNIIRKRASGEKAPSLR